MSPQETRLYRPDFLGIGAQKAGTSWLYRMLRQHPKVFLPPIKEIHFFDYLQFTTERARIETAFARELKGVARDPAFAAYAARLGRLVRTNPTWYAAVFAHLQAHDRCRGEITPAYAILPSEGIEAVRAANPDIRLIHIVRDPVARAVSHLKMHAKRLQRRCVDAAMLADPKISEAVFARSGYATIIPRWEAGLPRAQILHLAFRAIAERPVTLLREVEAFLGLPAHAYRKPRRKIHVTEPVAVEPEVVAVLEQKLAPHRAYIDERFGVGFG